MFLFVSLEFKNIISNTHRHAEIANTSSKTFTFKQFSSVYHSAFNAFDDLGPVFTVN